MSFTIGFVLLTHNKPQQAIRLVKRLNDMFGAPPIAWHHDFTQRDLPLDSITKNASLVRPHFQTAWAKFSVIEAMLTALKMLFESKNPPDWFILLSGADYPIKAAEKVAHDLSTSQYDVGSVQILSHIGSGDGFGLRDLRLIERPHVHVAFAGPSCASDVAQPCCCQVETGLAIREGSYDAGSASDLPHDPL